MPSRTDQPVPTSRSSIVADYLLAMTTTRTGLPAVVGAIVVNGDPGAVSGEAVVGEGEVDVRAIDAAIELLRDVPDPGEASASEWLAGLAGITNGTVRLTGPWNWDAKDREAIHWAMDEARLTARTVAIVRDGRVVPFPTDLPAPMTDPQSDDIPAVAASPGVGSPARLELPMFTYGLLQPGQLAHRAVIGDRPRCDPATLPGAALRLRDGVPILDVAENHGAVHGYLVWFEDARSGYERVGEFEPAKQYRWDERAVLAQDGRHEVANVLVGRRPRKGATDETFDRWDSRLDPVLTSGFDVASSMIDEVAAADFPVLPGESPALWDRFFRLSGAYLSADQLPMEAERLQTESMKNVLVRDVPDNVHAELTRRAERAGQSLQQFLAGELERIASRPSLDEVLDRIESERAGGQVGLATAVEDLESARDR